MNLLIFCAGVGVGAFVSLMAAIWLVGRVNKGSADRAEKASVLTAELMRERNELDKLKVTCLEGVRRAMENANESTALK